jgi:hypothetical protein
LSWNWLPQRRSHRRASMFRAAPSTSLVLKKSFRVHAPFAFVWPVGARGMMTPERGVLLPGVDRDPAGGDGVGGDSARAAERGCGPGPQAHRPDGSRSGSVSPACPVCPACRQAGDRQAAGRGAQGQVLDFVRFLTAKTAQGGLETALLSETVLSRDWLRPEEDEAWRDEGGRGEAGLVVEEYLRAQGRS